MGSPVVEAQEDSGTGKRPNPRTRFIEQFLRQGQQGRLAGLVLGQLDAFNRIATTFGHEQCDAFCSGYTDRLREVLPARTPIIRLSERRFALLVDCDSMSAIMDIAVALTENNPPQLTVGGDQFVVDCRVHDCPQLAIRLGSHSRLPLIESSVPISNVLSRHVRQSHVAQHGQQVVRQDRPVASCCRVAYRTALRSPPGAHPLLGKLGECW